MPDEDADLDNTIGEADVVRRAFDSLPLVVVDDDRLVVSGDVDGAATPTLESQILHQSRSGTLSLTIDLSAVTHLGSVGLRVPVEAIERSPHRGTNCDLVAPPDSPAHHVLVLVGQPVTTEAVTDRVD